MLLLLLLLLSAAAAAAAAPTLLLVLVVLVVDERARRILGPILVDVTNRMTCNFAVASESDSLPKTERHFQKQRKANDRISSAASFIVIFRFVKVHKVIQVVS
jgi:hypothetical protein